jgi:MFS family permease
VSIALAPFRLRDFRLLFAGELVSLLGTAVAPIALAFAVLDLTGSATDLGYVLAAGWMPQIVFILLGGVLGDRLPRNLVMVGANFLSAAAQGVTAALLLAGVAHVWELAVLQAVRGTATALFFPAAQAVIPEIVETELLQPANALIRLAQNASTVIGAGLGGVAVAAAGPGWAIAFDAATYLASGLILVWVHVPTVVTEAGETIVRQLVEGWKEFRSREWLWVIVVCASVGNPSLRRASTCSGRSLPSAISAARLRSAPSSLPKGPDSSWAGSSRCAGGPPGRCSFRSSRCFRPPWRSASTPECGSRP